jgi:hypothetical protein
MRRFPKKARKRAIFGFVQTSDKITSTPSRMPGKTALHRRPRRFHQFRRFPGSGVSGA